MLHTEDDSGHDDSRQGGFGNEGTIWHQESQTEDDQPASEDSSKRGFDSTGAVDSSSREGARGRHGLYKRPQHVADAQSHHLLAGIHWLASGCNKGNIIGTKWK